MIVLNESSPRYNDDIQGLNIELKPHQLAILHKMQQFENDYFIFAQSKTQQMRVKADKIEQVRSQLNDELSKDDKEQDKEIKETLEKEINSQQIQYDQEMADFLRQGFGVLGTSVGSGKTLCIISHILADKKQKNSNKTFNNNTVKGTMIVIPNHIYYQWIEEFDMHVEKGYLKITDFNNFNIVTNLYNEEHRKEILTSDVYLVTSSNYEMVANAFSDSNIPIKRLVFDEINTIANYMNTTISSAFVWFVSASIENEINKNSKYTLSAYGHNAKLIMQKLINADDKFVFDSFNIPPYTYQKKSISNHVLDKLIEIKGLLNENSINALNACDPISAFKALKFNVPVIGKDSKQLNDLQFVNLLYKKYITIPEDIQLNIESIQERLKSNDKVELYTPFQIQQFKNNLEEEQTKLNNAQHVIKQLEAILPDTNTEEFNELQRPKIVQLINLIDKLRDKKVMVYSKYPKIFNAIESFTADNSIGYSDFEEGTEEKLKQTMDNFKANSNINILGAHSVMFSCGTNLENLTHIIFVHKVSPDIKKQVIGRGQRPGRDSPLTVIELLHKNEIDN